MARGLTHGAAATAVALLGACGAPGDAFKAPLELGGQLVPAAVLNTGEALYSRYCATCHGADGRADTPAARQLEPRPRDFSQADFKYKATPGPALPSDPDLRATIRAGVAGTGMPPWPNLSDAELHAIVQYIKVFSPRWRTPEPPRATRAQSVLPARDPADSVRAGQSWRGNATPPPRTRLALRAAGPTPVARGER